MKKSLMAFVLTLALAASAFAAPRAGDLTSGVANGGDWLAFGARDLSALNARQEATLMTRALKLVGEEAAMLNQAGAFDVRATVKDGDFEKLDRLALAAELKDASLADLSKMAPGAGAPDFTVTAPEGTKITPVAVVNDENVGKVNVALLEREGALYLIAANGDPAVLADMAKAPADSPNVVAKTPANIWMQVNASKEMLAKNDAEVPVDFFAEIGIDDTPSSVKLIVWTNGIDLLDAALKDEEENSPLKNKSLRDVFNGGAAAKAPLAFGTAPLYALLNLSASFLPENFKLSDIMPAEDAAEAEKDVVAQISQAGFTWEDLVKQLRGNITLGLAGKLTAPMVGEIPGVYVNVTGIDAAKAKGLIDLAAAQLGGMLGTPAGYDANGWAGYKFSGMVSGILATGADGLLVAAMNEDQLGTVTEVAPGMASAVEPRNFALALNLKALQPVLQRLFKDWGDQLLEMAGETAKSQKAVIQQVLDNMGYVETFSIVTEDANTFIIEVAPDPALVNMALPPAEAAAELKPAA